MLIRVGLTDFDRRFIDVEVGWPGSCGDARVFHNSYLGGIHREYLQSLGINEKLVTGEDADGNQTFEEIHGFILGDSGYANTESFVTTYEVNQYQRNAVVRSLNERLSAARSRVENAFGILKKRFALLQRPLASASKGMPFTIQLIASLFVLHNFLIDCRDEWEMPSLPVTAKMGALLEDSEVVFTEAMVQGSDRTRDVLLRHIHYTVA